MNKLQMRDFWQDESGATALEYGIVIGLIALIIIGSMSKVSDKLIEILNSFADLLDAIN